MRKAGDHLDEMRSRIGKGEKGNVINNARFFLKNN